ncbi:hypothetical protein ACFZAU_32415 [Streptomyces sp. NPDC008238]
MDWFEAEAAEERRDRDAAIALVGVHAECCSPDPYRHNSHLWHMDLLLRAGRLPQLAELARMVTRDGAYTEWDSLPSEEYRVNGRSTT